MESSFTNMGAVKAANALCATRYGTHPAQPKAAQDKQSKENQVGFKELKTPPSDRILINELEGANEEIRAVARQIRQVDDTMDAIAQHLQEMTASLDEIVKSYPPYLQGSEERIAALRRFGGLRQLIDKLTLPPTDDTTIKILGDKNRYCEAGDWKLSIGKDQETIAIRHQPMHTGGDGLDLPELATDASDPAIHAALDQMGKSHEVFQKRRHAFATEANRVLAGLL